MYTVFELRPMFRGIPNFKGFRFGVCVTRVKILGISFGVLLLNDNNFIF